MEPSSRRSSEAALSSDSLEEEEVLMFKKGASYKQDSTKEKPGKDLKGVTKHCKGSKMTEESTSTEELRKKDSRRSAAVESENAGINGNLRELQDVSAAAIEAFQRMENLVSLLLRKLQTLFVDGDLRWENAISSDDLTRYMTATDSGGLGAVFVRVEYTWLQTWLKARHDKRLQVDGSEDHHVFLTQEFWNLAKQCSSTAREHTSSEVLSIYFPIDTAATLNFSDISKVYRVGFSLLSVFPGLVQYLPSVSNELDERRETFLLNKGSTDTKSALIEVSEEFEALESEADSFQSGTSAIWKLHLGAGANDVNVNFVFASRSRKRPITSINSQKLSNSSPQAKSLQLDYPNTSENLLIKFLHKFHGFSEASEIDELEFGTCSNCFRVGSGSNCSSCFLAHYCSGTCQTKHRKQHQSFCKEVKKKLEKHKRKLEAVDLDIEREVSRLQVLQSLISEETEKEQKVSPKRKKKRKSKSSSQGSKESKVKSPQKKGKPLLNEENSLDSLCEGDNGLINELKDRKDLLLKQSVLDTSVLHSKIGIFGNRGFCGLKNLGNTCYMNSTLQCLLHTGPLLTYFLRHDHTNDINYESTLGSRGRLVKSFANLVFQCYHSTKTAFSPDDIKKMIAKLPGSGGQFQGYRQHDAQELVTFFLDTLHEDLNLVKQKPYNQYDSDSEAEDVPTETVQLRKRLQKDLFAKSFLRLCYERSRENSFISLLFAGQTQHKLTCARESCRYESVSFSSFMSLSLAIPRKLKDNNKTLRAKASANKKVSLLIKLFVLRRQQKASALRFADAGRDTKAADYNGWDDLYEGKEYEAAMKVPEGGQHWHRNSMEVNASYELQQNVFGHKKRQRKRSQSLDISTSSLRVATDHRDNSLLPSSMEAPEGLSMFLEKTVSICIKSSPELAIEDVRQKIKAAVLNDAFVELADEKHRLEQNSMDVLFLSEYGTILPDAKRVRDILASQTEQNEEMEKDCPSKVIFLTGFLAETKGSVKSDTMRSEVKTCLQYQFSQSEGGKSPDSGLTFDSELSEDQLDTFSLCVPISLTMRLSDLRLLIMDLFLSFMAGPEKRYSRLEKLQYLVGVKIAVIVPNAHGSRTVFLDEYFSASTSRQRYRVLDLLSESDAELSSINSLTISIDFRPSIRSGSFLKGYFYQLQERHDPTYVTEVDRIRRLNEMYRKVEYDDGPVELTECLNHFIKEETLDEHNTWYCKKCKSHTQAQSISCLRRFPEILILCLKRFEHSRYRRSKIQNLVTFPLEGLDLRPYLAPDIQGIDENKEIRTMYDLYAITNHYGSLGGGHYTSFARTGSVKGKSQWFLFNDSRATKVEIADDIVTSAAYVLYFRKRK